MSRVDAPVCTEAIGVAETLLRRIAGWPPAAMALHGAPLADAATRLAVELAVALRLPDERASAQATADRLLVTLHVRLALARAAGLVPPGEAQALAARLEVAGAMLGGWRKRQRAKRTENQSQEDGQGATIASPAAARTSTTPTMRASRTGTSGLPTTGTTTRASASSGPPPEPADRRRRRAGRPPAADRAP